jgi:TPR repeat protein
MRIAKSLVGMTAVVLVLGLQPSLSLDGTPVPDVPLSSNLALAPTASLAPDAALSSNASVAPEPFHGSGSRQSTHKTFSVTSLQYAAEHGQGVAMWQLGRIYAKGEGVVQDDVRAFEYFRKFADSHADDNPAMPRSRFVANAFVSLGHYYLDGIPDSDVQPNPDRARRMFYHAASYFGDPEAQYQLAMLYVDGAGVVRDAKRAVPWLVLAANKGHYLSQAVLGRILFRGEHGVRQPASGLMWLTVACDGPGGNVPWISDLRASAFKQATDKERESALVLLERWVEGRRD